MSRHHFQLDKLLLISTHLEELCCVLRGEGPGDASPELTDEIAATAGELMLLLADHGQDELVRGSLEDARRLREAARTPSGGPRRAHLVAEGLTLMNDVALIISAERRAT